MFGENYTIKIAVKAGATSESIQGLDKMSSQLDGLSSQLKALQNNKQTNKQQSVQSSWIKDALITGAAALGGRAGAKGLKGFGGAKGRSIGPRQLGSQQVAQNIRRSVRVSTGKNTDATAQRRFAQEQSRNRSKVNIFGEGRTTPSSQEEDFETFYPRLLPSIPKKRLPPGEGLWNDPPNRSLPSAALEKRNAIDRENLQ